MISIAYEVQYKKYNILALKYVLEIVRIKLRIVSVLFFKQLIFELLN